MEEARGKDNKKWKKKKRILFLDLMCVCVCVKNSKQIPRMALSRGSILKDTEMSVLMLTHCVNLSILFHKQKAMAIFLK